MRVRLITTTILFTFIATSIAIAGQFGAPQPVANDKGFALGVGYFYSQNKWEPRDNTIDKDWKMTRNEVYIQASGALKYIEGYVRLGGSDMKLEDGLGVGNDFDDSGKAFGSVGARGIFYVTPSFGIGPVFQASVYDNFKDTAGPVTVEMKNPWEVGLALAFQGNIGDNLILYAGPYLFWSQFKVEDGPSWEAKSNFGGMGGIRFKFNRIFSIEAEGQYTNELSAGAVFNVSF